MSSPTPATISTPERVRAWSIAIWNKAVELLVLTKVRWQGGRLERFDRWALGAVHRLMLARVTRLRSTGDTGLTHVDERRTLIGVHNAVVVLTAPNPAWEYEAASEAAMLKRVLGDRAELHHIGSTAIVDLPAKPIIDLAAALPAERLVAGFSHTRVALANAGYRYVGVRGGHFFEKGPLPVRTHALQVHVAGSSELAELLRFRDALRADSALRTNYAATKAVLAAHFSRQRLLYVTYKFHWIAEWQWRTTGAADWATWFVAHKQSLARMVVAR
jgi:GrpB-like predicted nucleotidyltransferase (UPF0157 family)